MFMSSIREDDNRDRMQKEAMPKCNDDVYHDYIGVILNKNNTVIYTFVYV